MRGNGFADSAYKTFDSLWENEETEDSAWLLLASLDELKQGKNELGDKMNQLLASQNMGKHKYKLHDKTDRLQRRLNSWKFSEGALEENLLSRSQRDQVAEN